MSRYGTTEISNSDDVIDSRQVIERISELETELEGATKNANDVWLSEDGTTDLTEEAEELAALKALASEAEDYASDWKYGATLIRESYFVDYCEELVKDIGDMPSEIPSYIAIDWEKTADNIRVDYTEVDFDGVTYLVR